MPAAASLTVCSCAGSRPVVPMTWGVARRSRHCRVFRRRVGQRELDHDAGALEHPGRIVADRNAERAEPRSCACVLAERGMPGVVRGGDENASLGLGNFVDHRGPHAAGRPDHADFPDPPSRHPSVSFSRKTAYQIRPRAGPAGRVPRTPDPSGLAEFVECHHRGRVGAAVFRSRRGLLRPLLFGLGSRTEARNRPPGRRRRSPPS